MVKVVREYALETNSLYIGFDPAAVPPGCYEVSSKSVYVLGQMKFTTRKGATVVGLVQGTHRREPQLLMLEDLESDPATMEIFFLESNTALPDPWLQYVGTLMAANRLTHVFLRERPTTKADKDHAENGRSTAA